jgi:putative transposase
MEITFMTFWRLHYHIIWATHDRQPLLTAEREKLFYGVVYDKAKHLSLVIHAVGNVDDHIHLAVSIPPHISVSECVKHIKGTSSFAINHMAGSDGQFKWQEGYGALSIGDRSLPDVIAYVTNQKEHHRSHTERKIFECIDE